MIRPGLNQSRRLIPAVIGLLVLLAAWLGACQSAEDTIAGQAAPDFTLQDITGGSVTLSDYQGEQPVLLFFHMAVG